MLVLETKAYTYDELDDDAKERARDWWRSGGLDYDWWDAVYDDFQQIAGILGVTLATKPVPLVNGKTRSKPCIWFSGFSSQGDGASFEGSWTYAKGMKKAIRAHAPEDAVLHQIADRMQDVQRANFYQLRATISHRGRYCHSGCMSIAAERESDNYQAMTDGAEDEVADLLRGLADWLYRSLEREHDWLLSDEHVAEAIVANEYLFTEEGERA